MALACFIVAALGLILVLVSRHALFGGNVQSFPPKLGEIGIAVVIPARDEEENLPKLLESLHAQTCAPELILVVDDNSSDDTANIARASGVEVLSLNKLEPGWRGKPYALQKGAEEIGRLSKGDPATHLLFVDSDVELHRDCLENLTSFTRDYQAISLCPHHVIKAPYEQLSAFFNLLMVGGVGALSSLSNQRERTLFGQFLLISREAFDEVGAYESVKDKVLENLFLSERLRTAGFRCLALPGKRFARMRMFPEGYAQLLQSWTKGFSSGTQAVSPTLFAHSIILISGLFFVAIPTLIALLISAELGQKLAVLNLYLITTFLLFTNLRQVGNFGYLTALLYPFYLIFHQWVFFNARKRKKSGMTTQWKGRDVS